MKKTKDFTLLCFIVSVVPLSQLTRMRTEAVTALFLCHSGLLGNILPPKLLSGSSASSNTHSHNARTEIYVNKLGLNLVVWINPLSLPVCNQIWWQRNITVNCTNLYGYVGLSVANEPHWLRHSSSRNTSILIFSHQVKPSKSTVDLSLMVLVH